MRRTDCIIIGAGHAGLAMSRCLSVRGIAHAVVERGEPANSWRTERWESLRLLTPNWQSRLPGYGYDGDDPDGYRTVKDVATFIGRYARVIDAPVHTHTAVTAARGDDSGYLLHTTAGEWRCRAVVIASGACNIASVPVFAEAVPPQIRTLTTLDYKNPQQLEPGGVMIVGASASGVQIALELRRAGHEVTLSVGEHVRAPRLYRGRDIQWWMDASGLSDQRYGEVDDIIRARRLPSMQLIGSPERMTLDLNALRTMGVRQMGRLAGIRGTKALFSGSLRNQCTLADLKLTRLLDTFDAWAKAEDRALAPQFSSPVYGGLEGVKKSLQWCDFSPETPSARREGSARMRDEGGSVERLPPTEVDDSPPLELDLASGAIRTIIWATGYRPDYGWLDLPILDRKGQLKHDGGVTSAPGVYAMGLPFLRRRKSAFIDGAAADAADLSTHLHNFLSHRSA